MGYSVYLQLTDEEERTVEAFLANKEVAHFFDEVIGANGPHTRLTRSLSYMADEHQNGAWLGWDYGSYDLAHTCILWFCRVLGRDRYWYDGQDEMLTHDMMWRNSVSLVSLEGRRDPKKAKAEIREKFKGLSFLVWRRMWKDWKEQDDRLAELTQTFLTLWTKYGEANNG